MFKMKFSMNSLLLALILVSLLVETQTADLPGSKDKKKMHKRRRKKGHKLGSLNTVSAKIRRILQSEGYDPSIRPQFGEKPLKIDLAIRISHFASFEETNFQYTLTMHLYQFWRDKRLAFSRDPRNKVALTGPLLSKFWLPDTILANDKEASLHYITVQNKMIHIHGDGTIAYAMRVTATLSCLMELQRYPHDEQECRLNFKSYGFNNAEVKMNWLVEHENQGAIEGRENMHLPAFNFIHMKTDRLEEDMGHLGRYDLLSARFKMKRKLGHFFLSVFLPCMMVVVTSFNTFWLDLEANSARLTLGITTVLTISYIDSNVRSTLPPVSYTKAIDVYLLTSFMFIFASIIEYAVMDLGYWLVRGPKKMYKERQDEPFVPEKWDEEMRVESCDSTGESGTGGSGSGCWYERGGQGRGAGSLARQHKFGTCQRCRWNQLERRRRMQNQHRSVYGQFPIFNQVLLEPLREMGHGKETSTDTDAGPETIHEETIEPTEASSTFYGRQMSVVTQPLHTPYPVPSAPVARPSMHSRRSQQTPPPTYHHYHLKRLQRPRYRKRFAIKRALKGTKRMMRWAREYRARQQWKQRRRKVDMKESERKFPAAVDYWSRILFPAFFLLFNIGYWIKYL